MTGAVVEDRTDYCGNGWPSRKPCSYTGGCYCTRERLHLGRCVCVCSSWIFDSERHFEALLAEEPK